MDDHSNCAQRYWLSCPLAKVTVSIKNGIITDASPIASTFVGQPFQNLLTWFSKFGKVMCEKL